MISRFQFVQYDAIEFSGIRVIQIIRSVDKILIGLNWTKQAKYSKVKLSSMADQP